jgi:hypothetical protein
MAGTSPAMTADRHCEEYPDQGFALSGHRLRDEAIQLLKKDWIASLRSQ